MTALSPSPRPPHRHPPMPRWHANPEPGRCRWCGRWCRKHTGRIDRAAAWCAAVCREAAQVALGNADTIRRLLLARDGGRCRDCGDGLTRGWEGQLWNADGRDARDPMQVSDPELRSVLFRAQNRPVSLLMRLRWAAHEIDHDVPLWTVDRARPGAIRFWGLANQRLVCPDCHGAKTAAEAATRAKGKRQAAKFAGLRGLRQRRPKSLEAAP